MWCFPLFSGFCNGDNDVAKLTRSKYPLPAWGSSIDFHQDSMSRDTCSKSMSHLSHCLQTQGLKPPEVWLRVTSTPCSALKATVLGCTVSHPIRSFHLWRDASWHNTFGGLGECYLCVHRHSAPATKPKHAGSDLGHQWIGLFFSFGEITLRHSHESFFSYFT